MTGWIQENVTMQNTHRQETAHSQSQRSEGATARGASDTKAEEKRTGATLVADAFGFDDGQSQSHGAPLEVSNQQATSEAMKEAL
jgi:hypothetical protein